MTTDNLIVSPKGTLVFTRLRTPGKSMKKDSDVLEYSVTLDYDLSQPGVEEFKAQLEAINDGIIVTKSKSKTAKQIAPGHFRITARNRNRPVVFDENNEKLAAQDIPMIESGTASVVFSTFECKSGLGGGINLQAVQLVEINEFTGSNGGVDEDVLAAKLRGLK